MFLLQGPLASLEIANLLAQAAGCVINKHNSSCAVLDAMGGIDSTQRLWLAHLATRRDTYIIPAANCLGYIMHKRYDRNVDPNRDFAYSRRDDHCFLSTTAQIFKAVMERSIVQVVVTFHGGMVAIGYEWGAKNHMRPRDMSPDEFPHRDIAQIMRIYGGAFGKEKAYPGAARASL